MAKMTKAELGKKMVGLEDKLMDLIPIEEQDAMKTKRSKILDKVSNFVADLEQNLKDNTLAVIQALFDEGANCLAVEAEVKKAAKKAKKAESEENAEEPKKKVVKKSAKKAEDEPKADKKSAPKKKVEPKAEPKAFEFPKELEVELDEDEKAVYKMVSIKSLADIQEDDLIACEWTEEELKEYDYDITGEIKAPKKFDKDIDVCTVNGIGEKFVYAMSAVTDKMYFFKESEVKKMDSNGMPWRVYRPVA